MINNKLVEAYLINLHDQNPTPVCKIKTPTPDRVEPLLIDLENEDQEISVVAETHLPPTVNVVDIPHELAVLVSPISPSPVNYNNSTTQFISCDAYEDAVAN